MLSPNASTESRVEGIRRVPSRRTAISRPPCGTGRHFGWRTRTSADWTAGRPDSSPRTQFPMLSDVPQCLVPIRATLRPPRQTTLFTHCLFFVFLATSTSGVFFCIWNQLDFSLFSDDDSLMRKWRKHYNAMRYVRTWGPPSVRTVSLIVSCTHKQVI